MQDFPTHYPISELKILTFDLRYNGITNMNALDILG